MKKRSSSNAVLLVYRIVLTFSPSIVQFYYFVNVSHIFESLSLYLTYLVRVPTLISSEQQQIQHHPRKILHVLILCMYMCQNSYE